MVDVPHEHRGKLEAILAVLMVLLGVFGLAFIVSAAYAITLGSDLSASVIGLLGVGMFVSAYAVCLAMIELGG